MIQHIGVQVLHPENLRKSSKRVTHNCWLHYINLSLWATRSEDFLKGGIYLGFFENSHFEVVGSSLTRGIFFFHLKFKLKIMSKYFPLYVINNTGNILIVHKRCHKNWKFAIIRTA